MVLYKPLKCCHRLEMNLEIGMEMNLEIKVLGHYTQQKITLLILSPLNNSEMFEPRSHFISRGNMIVQVS